MNDLRTPASSADLVVVPGRPEELFAQAQDLAVLARSLDATGTVLRGLTGSTTWEGPAAEAFVRRAAPLPEALTRASQRYLVCATAVQAYAAELARCQPLMARAREAHLTAYWAGTRWAEAEGLALASGSPEERALAPTYRARMVTELETAQQARELFLRAHRRWQEADRACARTLEAASEDALTDSGLYRALGATIAVLDDVSLGAGVAAPFLGPFAPWAEGASDVTSGAALGLSAGVALGYGDVSWGELAARAAATAGPAIATKGLRSAAVAARMDGGAMPLVERLTVGARASVGRARSDVVVPAARASRAAPRDLPLGERLLHQQMDRVNRTYLDDLRIAAGDPTRTRLLVASWVVRDAPKVDKQAQRMQDAIGRIEDRLGDDTGGDSGDGRSDGRGDDPDGRTVPTGDRGR